MTPPAPLPPLPAHPLLVFLVTVFALLGLAFLLGRLAQRCGLPAVVGELATGVLLGPSVLGAAFPGAAAWLFPASAPEQIHLVDAVGLLGVLLLVGITGTHLDTRLMRRQGRTAAIVSLSGLVVPLGLGIALGFALPDALAAGHRGGRGMFALFLGVAMAVSAIPVIAKTLADLRLLHRNLGQLILTAGMIDDAVAWLLLSVVSAAVTAGVSPAGTGLSVGFLLAFLLFAGTVLRRFVHWAMTRAARADGAGPAGTVAALLMIGGGLLTHVLGMEPIFGAFVVGVLLAHSGAGQAKLASLRSVTMGILAPLFLASAGLRMDLRAVAVPEVAWGALAVLAVAITGKFAGAYLGARLGGLGRLEGIALGAGMNARGVVEVVVALTGLRLGVLDPATYTIVVIVAIVTSIIAPPVLRRTLAHLDPAEEERTRKQEHDSWQATPTPAATVDHRGPEPPRPS